jgi:glycine oxidase
MRVLVVGAGVIGAAVAWELLQRGAEVVLLDGAAEGGHTSAASAGMVNPFSLTPDDTPALPLYWQSLQMYPEWTRTLHERTGIDPEWRERGLPACCAHPCGRRASGGEPWRGFVATTPAPSESIRLHRAPDGACPEPRSRLLHFTFPAKAGCIPSGSCAHCIALCNLAAQTYTQDRLCFGSWRRTAQCAACKRRMARWKAMRWWSQRARGQARFYNRWGLHTPTTPVRGVILILGDLPLPVRRILSSPAGYLVPRADGTALLGATREQVGYDMRATAEGYALLTHTLSRLTPSLMHATVLGHTVGLRPDTPDHNPYLGAAAGYAGAVPCRWARLSRDSACPCDGARPRRPYPERHDRPADCAF